MILASHNEQMSANGAPEGAGGAFNRWQAPVRLNSIGEQGHLPVKTWRGFGPVLFQFNPHVALRRSPTLRRRQQLERTPRRSLLPVYCGGTPSRRWRRRGFALSAVMRLRFNSKTAQHAFHNAIEPSPVSTHALVSFANQRSERGFSSASIPMSRKQNG